MWSAPPAFDPARLLRIASRAASLVTRNPLVVEEAAERALHQLQLAFLTGTPIDHPEAWLCTVARRSALAMQRNARARTRTIEEKDDVPEPEPNAFPWTSDRLRCAIRSALTPRQRDALDAALSCRTTREAARTCHMNPRDFRRYLAAISRRARRRLDATEGSDGAAAAATPVD